MEIPFSYYESAVLVVGSIRIAAQEGTHASFVIPVSCDFEANTPGKAMRRWFVHLYIDFADSYGSHALAAPFGIDNYDASLADEILFAINL
jgi:hypothetical protein